MNKSKILLTTTKVLFVQALSSCNSQNQNEAFSSYALKWKCKKLWVSRKINYKSSLASTENFQWLKTCLEYSFVKLVCVDLSLNESDIEFWANSCKQAKKPIFIRLSSNFKSIKKESSINLFIKQIVDWILALLLLIIFSPILITIIFLLFFVSSNSIFLRQWRIGKKGELFQVLQFQVINSNIKNKHYLRLKSKAINRNFNFELWMNKLRTDKILQLINVLRGEMSIVGPRALTLHEVLQVNPKNGNYLYPIPGVIKGRISIE